MIWNQEQLYFLYFLLNNTHLIKYMYSKISLDDLTFNLDIY